MSLTPSSLPRRHKLRAALLGAVAAVAIGAVVVETGAFAPNFAVADTQQPSAGPASFADVVDRVKSSVVSVKVKMDQTSDAESDVQGMPHFPPGSPFDRFFKQFGVARRPGPGRHANAAPPASPDHGAGFRLLHLG